MNAKAIQIFRNLKDVAEKHRESIASIFGHLSCEENSEVQDILGEIADMVAQEKGVGKAVKVILSDEIFQKFVESMTVPDWVLLYFKLSARLPDEAWQMLLNLTRLGNTGKCADVPLLLSKNKIKAVRRVFFKVIKDTFCVNSLPDPLIGSQVNLASVIIWIIREQRLHQWTRILLN
ncbi:hypothetical protein OS493_030735 [Desmophyllum pertusum]|uniref:Uncharacterized protein n=1 Tax=Desmophyllum pertusum TaxID=174260 RepID=A0A9W9Z9A2_9CNID|nr:hypothetical protein OS493_030735 [Desmophyllum pertusum]